MRRIDRKWLLVVALFLPSMVEGQSILNTPHNLSVSGPGDVKAATETEVCVFCHTPHRSSGQAPLWNRKDPGSIYKLYSSSTMLAAPGQPTGSSVLCLSCHDGTLALGDVLSRSAPIAFAGGVTTMPSGHSNLGTNLSDDHPVSFYYSSTLSASEGELADPATLTGPVRLENGQLQCTSCHDPHKDLYGNFLVASRRYSTLCRYCHQKRGWDNASHAVSSATWNGLGNNPWFHTSYATVSENACENCHDPHAAEGEERLLNAKPEEENCLVCHNGNVAQTDIQSELAKTYRHDVFSYQGVHDPSEPAVVSRRHVECVDCHNPHAAKASNASAPDATGALLGVRGVDTQGNAVEEIRYEYQLCYRCHADSPNKPGSPTQRQVEQSNVRLEFDPSNPSYHPVEAPGRNDNVPSLIAPLNENSVIYCTDCHASNGTGVPKGPHGSIYPHILKFQYMTADGTAESYQAYELCYSCHDRGQIINGMGRFYKRIHRKHIVRENTPCNVCHDPHGISSSQGDATNHSHLINFDLSVVSPDPRTGRLEFVDTGNFSGKCYLECHGRRHSPKSY